MKKKENRCEIYISKRNMSDTVLSSVTITYDKITMGNVIITPSGITINGRAL
jgi:hypothetical protein